MRMLNNEEPLTMNRASRLAGGGICAVMLLASTIAHGWVPGGVGNCSTDLCNALRESADRMTAVKRDAAMVPTVTRFTARNLGNGQFSVEWDVGHARAADGFCVQWRRVSYRGDSAWSDQCEDREVTKNAPHQVTLDGAAVSQCHNPMVGTASVTMDVKVKLQFEAGVYTLESPWSQASRSGATCDKSLGVTDG